MGDFFDELEGDFFEELADIGDRPQRVGDTFTIKKAYPKSWEGQVYVVTRVEIEQYELSGSMKTYYCNRIGTDDYWFMNDASIQRTVRERGFRILKNGTDNRRP